MPRVFLLLLLILIFAALLPAQPPVAPPLLPVPLFTDAERAAIIAYWNVPARQGVLPPKDVATKGVYQVRQTVEGSEWLLRYKRAIEESGAPPTANPLTSDFNPEWKRWVNAKLTYDRYIAAQSANGANAELTHRVLPPGPAAPPYPGTIPATLLVACGNPPLLANVVAPLLTTIQFSGEADIYEYLDNVVLPEWYPYYRFARGTISYGKQIAALPQSEQDDLFRTARFSKSDQKIMSAVSPLEGGFDTVNTYDTGFVSIGFLQFITWNDGRGSLSDVMLNMKRDKPTDFNNEFRRFGVDVNILDKTLTVIDPSTGAELRDLPAVLRVIEDKRLTAVFQRAGRRTPFRVAQIQTAKSNYWPADDVAVATLENGTILTGKVSDIVKSEAGMATLFDRKVNQGRIFPKFNTVIGEMAKAKRVTKFKDLGKYERDIIMQMRYRDDFLNAAKWPSLSKPRNP